MKGQRKTDTIRVSKKRIQSLREKKAQKRELRQKNNRK
jgi:hypothetical protein